GQGLAGARSFLPEAGRKPGPNPEAKGCPALRRVPIRHTSPPAGAIASDLGLRLIGAMKKIGFLSFGHWTPSPHSQTRTASDALLQSIDLAIAAEEAGADGAYFRVHHFARQLASPFPLLAAIGARTKRIEIGTAVIDMPY